MPEHVRKGARGRLTLSRRQVAGALALLGAFVLGRAGTGDTAHPAPDTPAVRDADALLHELDTIEARLQTSLGQVELMKELARRHEQVSALACVAAEEHAREGLELARRAQRRAWRLASSARAERATHAEHDNE